MRLRHILVDFLVSFSSSSHFDNRQLDEENDTKKSSGLASNASYIEHAEDKKASARVNYIEHAEEKKASSRANYIEHAEERKAYFKAYHEEHRDERLASFNIYYEANKHLRKHTAPGCDCMSKNKANK